MEHENENITPAYRLKELSHSDYEIKDGEPDIIGWDVKNTEGRKLGEVDELIFDPQARKVRYLALNMESNEMHLEDERRVLIPIGIAQLDTKDDHVILPNITTEQLKELPPYENCPELSPAFEAEIRHVFEGSTASAAPYGHPQFYEHAHFDEDKFYGRGSELPDKDTIAPADDMEPGDEAARAARASRIVDKLNRRDRPGETK